MRSKTGLFAVALLALAGCRNASEPDDSKPAAAVVEAVTAKSESIRELLPLDGTFQMPEGTSTKLAPVEAGKLLSVSVREGDHVHRAQRLATIDTSVLAAQSQSAVEGAAAAAAQAKQADADLRAARVDLSSAIATAQLALDEAIAERDSDIEQAKVELARVKSGSRTQEISQAKQSVAQARVTRDRAQTDYERTKRLFDKGYVSRQQLDTAKAAYDVSESALTQAEDQLSLLQEGPRKEEVRAAELKLKAANDIGNKKVQLARAALVRAKQGAHTVDARVQEAAAAQKTASQKASEAIAATQSQKNGEIIAPYDGYVVRRFLNPGDSADAATPVLEIAKRGATIDFVGAISPSDAARINVGMSALVADSASVVGRVSSVGTANASGLVPVRVRCYRPIPGHSSGAFGTLQVILRTLPAAVTVPNDAVLEREDKTVVFVAENGVAHIRTVEVGPRESGRVAILKGLRAGEQVIRIGQYELSDGSPVEVKQ